MALPSFTLNLERVREVRSWPVLISLFDNESEERRLVTSRKVLVFVCISPVGSQADIEAYMDFFDARSGMLDKFTFTNPNDSTSYTVRFAAPIEIDDEPGYFRARFSLKVLYEDE
jgi:hypothetical protein